MKKQKQEKIPEVMSLSQLKKYLHTRFEYVKTLVDSGEIKGRQLGNKWCIHKSEVDRWLTHKEANQ